ncbi:hypothetical protein ATCC90586_001334 [Pythium insidiosum]|nr:hypothetical protein ATCC90586_001334 [Pythium insidiosum]
MSGVVHVLSASITSALAIKPSTVYVLRVENLQTGDVWHIRRCFSEFCDLREKMLVLIDGPQAAATGASSPTQQSPSPTTTMAPMRVLTLRSQQRRGSGSSCGSSSGNSGPVHERFPFLYSKFPRRQFFGSRSKKVIEQRTVALNQFLQEAMWFVRELRNQHRIATYFSLMTQLEVFLDVAKHTPATRVLPALFIAPGPLAQSADEVVRAIAARGFAAEDSNNDSDSDGEEDAMDDRRVLKKTVSCFLTREVLERRHDPAGDWLARASERDQRITATDSWAARIEIAGFSSKDVQQRRSKPTRDVMLVRQQPSDPSTDGKASFAFEMTPECLP